MNHHSIPEKPLFASVGGRVEKPNTVYFFERPNGSIFSAEEEEAWTIYSKGIQVIGEGRDKPKLIGTGTGEIFHAAIVKSQEVGKTDIKAAQEIIRQGERDELEACRGKIIPPRNRDKFGNGAAHI